MGNKDSKAKKAEAKKPQPSPVAPQAPIQTTASPKAPAPAVSTFKPMKVLIVFANPEPQSFCHAILETTITALKSKGHSVQVSDLYKMKMFNHLDKTDFDELENPDYFKPQAEQVHSNKEHFVTFSAEVRAEHEKVQWCDLIMFIFPMYWWSFPGIMKSWIDRILSMGFAYGMKSGTSLKGRKGMFIYTTGGPKEFHRSIGLEPCVWKMIAQGVFKFCEVTPLEPYVAYQVAWIDDNSRKAYLKDIKDIMENIDKRAEFNIPA